jgi:hypothetical protein
MKVALGKRRVSEGVGRNGDRLFRSDQGDYWNELENGERHAAMETASFEAMK